MNNSTLFKQAHRMTKLTIQHNETYRFKFGQWLIFIKAGITNFIKPAHKRVNQSVCYVPLLEHDKYQKITFTTPFKVSRITSSKSGSLKLTETYDFTRLAICFIIVLQFIIVLNLV